MKFKSTIFVTALLALSLTGYTAERSTFQSGDVTLSYLEAGSGDTVILLHGFGGSAEGLYLKPGTIDALDHAGYRVIALDQRGHGYSGKPYAVASYGLEMVEDLRRLLDHLGVERVHLVGYSMGAKVSNSFRERYPERLRSLTLGGYGWPWRGERRTLAESRASLEQREVLPGNDLQALAAVNAGSYELMPSAESLRANETPTLAIIGAADEVVPANDVESLRATMANLEFVQIPGTHAGPDGAPYKPVFAEKLIDFLDRH